MLENFHFTQPEWFFALIPLALVYWWMKYRKIDVRPAEEEKQGRFLPTDPSVLRE